MHLNNNKKKAIIIASSLVILALLFGGFGKELASITQQPEPYY